LIEEASQEDFDLFGVDSKDFLGILKFRELLRRYKPTADADQLVETSSNEKPKRKRQKTNDFIKLETLNLHGEELHLILIERILKSAFFNAEVSESQDLFKTFNVALFICHQRYLQVYSQDKNEFSNLGDDLSRYFNGNIEDEQSKSMVKALASFFLEVLKNVKAKRQKNCNKWKVKLFLLFKIILNKEMVRANVIDNMNMRLSDFRVIFALDHVDKYNSFKRQVQDLYHDDYEFGVRIYDHFTLEDFNGWLKGAGLVHQFCSKNFKEDADFLDENVMQLLGWILHTYCMVQGHPEKKLMLCGTFGKYLPLVPFDWFFVHIENTIGALGVDLFLSAFMEFLSGNIEATKTFVLSKLSESSLKQFQLAVENVTPSPSLTHNAIPEFVKDDFESALRQIDDIDDCNSSLFSVDNTLKNCLACGFALASKLYQQNGNPERNNDPVIRQYFEFGSIFSIHIATVLSVKESGWKFLSTTSREINCK